VYVGGILVILIFGVMLTNKLRDLRPETGFVNVFPALLASLALFFALALLIESLPERTAVALPADDVKEIGKATLTHFLLPFELVSILLLAVLMGAAYLSRRDRVPAKEVNG
jgi:NADH-quinone oxidoreductase subunit J